MSKPSKTGKPSADKRTLDRRSFFVIGGSAVAAAAVVPLAGEAEAAAEQPNEAKKARYKETEHVKNYYRVNRY